MAFHVDSGQVDEVDEVDVGGLTVAVFADTPPMMIEGDWRVGLFIDANASEQQSAKLAFAPPCSGDCGMVRAGREPP